MKLEAIDWSLQRCVEDLRRTYGNETSAHAFPSLYIWKTDMKLSLFRSQEVFAVQFGLRGDNSWFFPCGARAAVRAFVEERLQQGGEPCRFYYAQAEEAALLEQWFPGRFNIQRSPEDDEYLYSRQEQLELKGRLYRHQRNDLRRAQERHALQVFPVDTENLEQCRKVLNDWKALHHSRDQSGLMDVSAGETMLRNLKELEISGVLVKVCGKPAAVAAGYPLTDTVFDLCVCQQTTPAPEISTFARYALFQGLGEKILEVNAEEDLGITGLRSLKEGMRPSRKIEMYTCIQQR